MLFFVAFPSERTVNKGDKPQTSQKDKRGETNWVSNKSKEIRGQEWS